MTNEEAIEIIKKLFNTQGIDALTKEELTALIIAIEALRAQKVGKWITETDEFGDVWIVCSACREKFCPDFKYYPNYCPECGAKMVDTTCDCFRQEFGKDVCYGTRERDECTCKGDERRCDFYDNRRAGS